MPITGSRPIPGSVCSWSFDQETPRLRSTHCPTVVVFQSSGCGSASVGRITGLREQTEERLLGLFHFLLSLGQCFECRPHLNMRLWFEGIHITRYIKVELVLLDLFHPHDAGMLKQFVRIAIESD